MLKNAEIFKIIAEVTGVPKKQVQAVFMTYTDLLKTELKSQGEIKFPDVGKFKVALTNERISRNPATGQMIKVPPKAKIRFTPVKDIKEEVAKVKWEYVKEAKKTA